jgi:hypothetical protein
VLNNQPELAKISIENFYDCSKISSDQIMKEISENSSKKTVKTSYAQAFNSTNLRTTLVCFGIAMYHEFSGINVVLAYSSSIV